MEGLTLEEMKISGTRKLFFSKGERKAFYFPTNIDHEVLDDQFNKGKKAVRIGFENTDENLQVTAAQNPDGSIAVIAFNEGDEDKTIELALNDKSTNLSSLQL